ncbi:MAG: amidohydrolase family protein [Actinobacteria bacterium]|nr:amidohydrolase family protein [Actinomycetota bacterium]
MAARTVFAGGMVFDGTGAPPAPADIVVESGRVVDIGPGLDGDEVVDCAGQAVLPGLFDCHVHVTVSAPDLLALAQAPFSLQFYEAARNLRATLAAGITTVRDAGGADLGIRVARERGLVTGPRLQISINMISQTGGHNDDWEASGCYLYWFMPHPGRPDGVADGPDEVRRKVRELIRAGADVIKVATSGGVLSARDDPRHGHYRDAEVAVMVEEASAAGLSVMSHAGATEGIKVAVRNGVRSIEHGDWLDDEAIAMMLDQGTWLVPTLIAGRGVLAAGQAGVPLGDHILAKARLVVEAQADSVRRAIAAGVRVAMGTDSGVTPHGRNLDELPLMVGCGMTPAQALHSATLSAAELMGLADELGSLEPGKRADLVVADGDPLDVGTLAERIRRVYQDGRLVHDSGVPALAGTR